MYERRHAIITGAAEPTSEEIAAGEAYSIKDDEEYTPLPKDSKPSAGGIPEFWLTALRNHVGLSELITDRDAAALKHLLDVRIAYLDDTADDAKPGFKLIFVFSPNDFFENEVLEKTYVYQEEVGYSGDFVYDRAIGTEIRWKEDKDLTKEFEIKKQRNKSMLLLSMTLGVPSSNHAAQIQTAHVSCAKLTQPSRSSTFSRLLCPQQRTQSRMEISTTRSLKKSRRNSRWTIKLAKISRRKSVTLYRIPT